MEVNAPSTGASAENIRLINSGDAELAIVQNDVADYAYNGINAFEGERSSPSLWWLPCTPSSCSWW